MLIKNHKKNLREKNPERCCCSSEEKDKVYKALGLIPNR